jgi:hypothetical protein
VRVLTSRAYRLVRLAYQLISHQPAVLLSEQISHQQPATVFFSQNKPAPAISHQPTEHAVFRHFLASPPPTESSSYRLVCLSGLWLFAKASRLWAVEKQLWEKQKMAWLNGCGFEKHLSLTSVSRATHLINLPVIQSPTAAHPLLSPLSFLFLFFTFLLGFR